MPPLSVLSRRAAVAMAALPLLRPGTGAKKRKRKKRKNRCLALRARCTPSKAPQCCAGTACGTSQIEGSFCCLRQGSACAFSPERDACCPGFACSEAEGTCVPLA